MDNTETRKVIKKLAEDIDNLPEGKIASNQKTLLNLVEILATDNESLRKENQNLKDEINRLKGEQGKPEVREQKKHDKNNHSSEEDRGKRKKNLRKAKKKKKKNIKIDKKVICDINKNGLPDDLIFKGYEKVVIQDIKIHTDNIEFSRAAYYSPSLKKTFLGDLPEGYYGEFGPGIRSLVITLYRDSGMTESAIKRFMDTFGIDISKATISRMITERHELFHQEKEDIFLAGLNSTRHQHIDDTGSRVNGKNHYTHILCNQYYTAFFTMQKKDRLSVLSILCCGELKFTCNEVSFKLMLELGLSGKQAATLKAMNVARDDMSRKDIDNILNQLFPNPKKQKANRRIILEACAIVYYKSLDYAIEHLICDDAPQFNKLAKYKSLCWIHEGRHYKKLNPFFEQHRKTVCAFNDKFWDFYMELLVYKQNPSSERSQDLLLMFDSLFSTKTGYDILDERIAMTLAKKKSLLLVLEFPFLPLHNNNAELGARVQARIRDINLQTITENGTKSKDTFATIVQTARKLGVNIYEYIYDRMRKKFKMKSLATLISEQAKSTFDTS